MTASLQHDYSYDHLYSAQSRPVGDPVSATRAEFPLCPLRVDGWGHHGPPSSSCTIVTTDSHVIVAAHTQPPCKLMSPGRLRPSGLLPWVHQD